MSLMTNHLHFLCGTHINDRHSSQCDAKDKIPIIILICSRVQNTQLGPSIAKLKSKARNAKVRLITPSFLLYGLVSSVTVELQ